MDFIHPIKNGQIKRRYGLERTCRDTKKDLLDKTRSIKQLDGVKLIKLEADLINYSNKLIKKIETSITFGIGDVVITTIKYYEKGYEKKTGYKLPEYAIKKLTKETYRKFLSKPFMGNTLENRIARLRRRQEVNIRNRLRSVLGQNGKGVFDSVYPCFYSIVPVEGGSLAGGFSTILVGEENRAYHEAALEFFGYIGIRHVRFILPPEHKGKDICDTIAAYVDPTIRISNPVGVYKIEDLPKAPHPRAFYYLEPVYELGFVVPGGALKIKNEEE